MSTRYKRHPDLRLTELEGEGVVLHLGSRRYFSVSETGLLILNQLEQQRTEAELVDALIAEYEVDRPRAEQSVRDFLAKCSDSKLLLTIDG